MQYPDSQQDPLQLLRLTSTPQGNGFLFTHIRFSGLLDYR